MSLPTSLNNHSAQLTWYPSARYSINAQQQHDALGFAFTPQSGEDAIGTSRVRPFQRKAHTLAYIPKGCDVLSRSDQGGDYLLLTLIDSSISLAEKCYTNLNGQQASTAAKALQRHLLNNGSACLEVEVCILTLLQTFKYSNKQHVLSTARLSAYGLKKVELIVEQHLHLALRIHQLATALNLSDAYFSRAFKASTGVSPYRYILLRRLGRAKGLLSSSRLKLAEIAAECGFSSAAHLCNAFKHYYGINPSQASSSQKQLNIRINIS
jgi:AraC family transcriptional regulator